MKISEITHRAYQWGGENRRWQVGKPLVADEQFVYREELIVHDLANREWVWQVLMQPSHASPPTWVRLDDLQPYPVEPIEEPIVKGGEP